MSEKVSPENLAAILKSVSSTVYEFQKGQFSRAETLKKVIQLIASANPLFHWVGIYELETDERHLSLHEFYIGRPTEHTRISIEKGICGSAARENRTILLNNVHEDSRHIACSLQTNSELVVPIRHENKVVAEIDIDSDLLGAFNKFDQELVEEISKTIAILFAN